MSKINKQIRISLAGNPNSGKSSVFNLLTGLSQKVGNYPGVTVDKKTGRFRLDGDTEVLVTDLPGIYSLFPNAEDERVVVEALTAPGSAEYPDLILYVANASQLEKHLLLFTQILDLGLPVILLLNMSDVVREKAIRIDADALGKYFDVPVLHFNGRTGEGLPALRELLASDTIKSSSTTIYEPGEGIRSAADEQAAEQGIHPYLAKLWLHHHSWLRHLSDQQRFSVGETAARHGFDNISEQVRETMSRFDTVQPVIRKAVTIPQSDAPSVSSRIDKVVTHPVAGPLIFSALMLLVFQAIYAWSSYPMDLIDAGFIQLSSWVQEHLSAGWFTDLLTEGIIAGLGGILIFVPQIAILFFLLALMEESGYMARAIYLFDSLMQRFGLNGRSVVALISGGACAIPAIMSTRTISNWKERLTTIMVTPLISCSARIPIYTVLIGLLVPGDASWGWFNVQGLVFMGLYVLGILSALLIAWIMKLLIKSRERSLLLIELPDYRMPLWRNVGLHVKEKAGVFVTQAGKVILLISVVLWFLASYGPGDSMNTARIAGEASAQQQEMDEEQRASLVAAYQLEASYAGRLGHLIEPAIRPLGFDWKIGISLITSFAAREVFVGTMATIYSVGSDEETSVREKLAQATDPRTGKKIYTFATTLSLLIFYVFAMQCMSTFAIVRRETKGLKWPMIQLVLFSLIAYFGSLITYQWLQ